MGRFPFRSVLGRWRTSRCVNGGRRPGPRPRRRGARAPGMHGSGCCTSTTAPTWGPSCGSR
eukprot:9517253-Heterocapsa_arctica.AAC.1